MPWIGWLGYVLRWLSCPLAGLSSSCSSGHCFLVNTLSVAASLDSFQTHLLIPPRLFPETTSQVNYWCSDPCLQSAPTDPKPGQKYIHTANLPQAYTSWASLVTQVIKSLPASARDLVLIPKLGRSSGGGNGNPLCLGNPIDREVWCAYMESQRVGHDWATHTHTHTHTHMITPVLRLVIWEKTKPNKIPAFSVLTLFPT